MKAVAFAIVAAAIIIVDGYATVNNRGEAGWLYFFLFVWCFIGMHVS